MAVGNVHIKVFDKSIRLIICIKLILYNPCFKPLHQKTGDFVNLHQMKLSNDIIIIIIKSFFI